MRDIGTIIVSDKDRSVRLWTREGGPFFPVAYELFSLFEKECPWPFGVESVDNHGRVFTIYIRESEPRRMGTLGIDALKFASGLADVLGGHNA